MKELSSDTFLTSMLIYIYIAALLTAWSDKYYVPEDSYWMKLLTYDNAKAMFTVPPIVL